MRYLVVDDDHLLREYVCIALREEGAVVDQASTAKQGLAMALAQEYDALILDYMLPDRTGVQLVREMRDSGRLTPVLMITVRDDKDDVIGALDAGADDYVIKPFAIGELKARLRALLRRGERVRTKRARLLDLELDRLERVVTCQDKPISLTPKEFSLLEQLLLQPDQVLTRAELLEKVWDLHFDPGSNVVDVHVSRLRRKLRRAKSEVELETVRGTGFVLRQPQAAERE